MNGGEILTSFPATSYQLAFTGEDIKLLKHFPGFITIIIIFLTVDFVTLRFSNQNFLAFQPLIGVSEKLRL